MVRLLGVSLLNRWPFIIALGLIITLWGISSRRVFAQPFTTNESGLAPPIIEEIEQATRAHLEQAQLLISAQEWAEAVRTLRRVMETDGDRLIAITDPADAPMIRYVPVRQYGQTILARWAATAPEALRHYRSELDSLAKRWLEEGRARRDESLLRDLAHQLFATSYGDDALWTLGEYALERGEYHRARGFWERISPALRSLPQPVATAGRPLWRTVPEQADDPAWQNLVTELPATPVSTSWLSYPDTDLNVADIRARLVLVSILEGSFPRAQRELALLERLHPEATGTLTGRTGKYSDLLRGVLDDSQNWRKPLVSEDWSTFAGNQSRSLIARHTIDVGGRPLWRVPLPRVDGRADMLAVNRLRPAERNDAILSYFPVVVDDQVLIALGDRIHGFDLRTGKGLFGSVGREDADGGILPGLLYEASFRRRSDLPVPQLGIPRFSLTVNQDRLFARVGAPYTRVARVPRDSDGAGGVIVGLDLSAEARLLPGFPLATDDATWSFEGTPVVAGRLVYIGMKRQDEVRVEAYVACYDSVGGQRLWRRLICAAETPGQGRYDEITHNLLTLHEGTLFYNTNLGVIGALSADDGRLRWLLRYPRSVGSSQSDHPGESHLFRSLNPPLSYRDVLVCAPSDSDRLFALDAFTGQLLWTTPAGYASDVVHLLGVAEDHLIASGESLYWFDVYGGGMRGQFPEAYRDAIGHARPKLRGFGRGLLSNGHVYWPTHDQIFVFHQRPAPSPGGGSPVAARAPIHLQMHQAKGGNLIAAGRLLLIAGADELIALSPWGSAASAQVSEARFRPSAAEPSSGRVDSSVQ